MSVNEASNSKMIKITAIDTHVAGEPLRIIKEGFPEIQGKTMLEKRKYARKFFDHLRTALMWEPRGHADMYGCIITEPVTSDGDIGVLFMHNEGFSTMCGHGIIGLATTAVETELISLKNNEPMIKIDTPAGRVTAKVSIENNRVQKVSFTNVPSFVYSMDEEVDVPGFGLIRYDIAFGGAFYAICHSEKLGLNLIPQNFQLLVHTGRAIKHAVIEHKSIQHPFEEDMGFLYGTIFVAPSAEKDSHSRNVCVFADGEIDRSPTGTGVSARAALHYTRGELEIGEKFKVESILGTSFTGWVVEETKFGPYNAVIPEIEGSAYITGVNDFLIDPKDPLRYGFLLR
ncbi:MAG: proline racemase family protein [Candidatus Aminicenantaceae bacterium]